MKVKELIQQLEMLNPEKKINFRAYTNEKKKYTDLKDKRMERIKEVQFYQGTREKIDACTPIPELLRLIDTPINLSLGNYIYRVTIKIEKDDEV